jgi:hypothetical protein
MVLLPVTVVLRLVALLLLLLRLALALMMTTTRLPLGVGAAALLLGSSTLPDPKRYRRHRPAAQACCWARPHRSLRRLHR